eukprot:TRINITY_DN420_c0_g1_i4.p1 TRINITY_DN420_c0_g1~~TRINITY_DN420_c0_g1_i4.p1  ORF type:complete len:124 (-),score=3.02 TRINITY_DN420_c0_g1_i4:287-658(-)
MFKKFSKESLTSRSQPKRSAIRMMRKKIQETYPTIEPYLDEILPAKAPVVLVKCAGHIQLVVVNNEIIFFQIRDSPLYPTLRLCHKYPVFGPKVQVDKGAIRKILGGAHIMCPGITSAGDCTC